MKPVIGLTGGIGSGKSTVAAILEGLGATIVDTDAIARRLTQAGGAVMARIGAEFGPAYVGADGSLDRTAMRALAFGDAAARERLEAILHPAIRAQADEALAKAPGAYAIVMVPLLYETRGYLDRVARVLVVDCPESVQVERTTARSGLASREVRAIMSAQWPRWRRLQMADDVVWNGAGRDALEPQCARLHVLYAGMGRG